MDENFRPLVSVIITTRNEEDNIENCLKSVQGQSYPEDNIEAIVVDNNSIDKTKEIAYRYTNKVYNLGPERSAQRNFGIREAKGKYILYLDADMMLSKDVIKECVDKCENGNYVALYIPERIINLSSNQLENLCNLDFNLCNQCYWIKVRDFERSFYNGICIDAVRFLRRDKFLEIGGVDETLNGHEDWNLDHRIRTKENVKIVQLQTR